MSFRTVVIRNRCKLSYKNGHMIVRGDVVNSIHLSEIGYLIVENINVTITTYLLYQLINEKIKLLICDNECNPLGELTPLYGSHNTSKRIYEQTTWNKEIQDLLWTEIVKEKIRKQIYLLKIKGKEFHLLEKYLSNVKLCDISNREGHSAKAYFSNLFGKDFTRDKNCSINAALNYGYHILLSSFNKEIVSKGYITNIGINHKNQFNNFNLSCDFMEPFRCIVDNIVYENQKREFDISYKDDLKNILNNIIVIGGKEQYLSYGINIYITSLFKYLNGSTDEVLFYDFYEV